LADAEEQKKDATILYRATVKTKDGRTATSQVAAVFGKGDGVAGDDHFGGAILYRFKVHSADGKEYASKAVPGVRAKFVASELKWGDDQHAHGAETIMTAKVKYDAGRPVRFVVQHDHYGSWLPYATVPAVVKDGVATAKLQAHHPLLQPGQPKPLPSEMEGIDKAHRRFTVELGRALPQQQHAPAPPPAQLARDLKFTASNLQWGGTDHTHGSETTMQAQVMFDRGQPVRFVVEHDHAGRWEPYATVPATVENGLATAALKIRHPAFKQGATPGDDDIAHLRFHVELGEAQPQPDEPFKASQLQWGDQAHAHGDETTMQARVENDFKKPVRFVVEHNDNGTWKPYATVPAVVRNGLATATLRVDHPALKPGANASAAARAQAAKLRFKVELGDAQEQPAPPPPALQPKLQPVPKPPPPPAKPVEPPKPVPVEPPKPVEVKLNLKVKDPDGNPHEARPFEIHLADGKVVKGTTTADGIVQASVPKGQPARLVVQGKEGPHTIQLQLGKLEPPETPKGAQQRLASLGYKVQVTGKLDAPTKLALAAFHHDHALPGKPEIAAIAKHLHLAYQGK